MTPVPHIKTILGPTILLANGEYLDLLAPEASAWGASEIAEGLSKTCRFSGQCRGFYSVAEHSVLVASLVPHELRRAALLHDASEAFIGDVTAPLKSLLPEYRVIEQRLEAEVARRFRLPNPLPPEIKHADRQALHIEQRYLMRNTDHWPGASEPEPATTPYRPQCLPWHKARDLWLRSFQALAPVPA